MAQYGLAYLIKHVIKMSDIRQRRLRHLYIFPPVGLPHKVVPKLYIYTCRELQGGC